MSKVALLQCDVCGQYSNTDNPVMTVTVCGPRFDICLSDQYSLLETCGVDGDKARRYVDFLWEHRDKAGRKPTLADIDPEPDEEPAAPVEHLELGADQAEEDLLPEANHQPRPTKRRKPAVAADATE